MSSTLAFLGRYATAAMAAGVLVGLAVPGMAGGLSPLLTPSVWLLLFLSAMRLDWRALAGHARRPLRIILVTVWLLALSPLLMWALVNAAGVPPGVATGMTLAAASAPLMSTPAIGLMLGLDAGLLLVLLTIATLALPLTLPVLVLGLLDLELSLGGWDLSLRLGVFIVTALVSAAIARRLIGAERLERHGRELDGTSVIVLLVFAVAMMEGVWDRMLADPGHVALITALSFAVYGGLMVAAAAGFRLLAPAADLRVALSVGLVSGCRNLGILLAILPSDADPDIRLFFALGQFPIYMMPAVLKFIFARLLPSVDADAKKARHEE